MTHDELVDRAVRWLKTTKRCPVVFREHTAGPESPDALGYRGGWSYLVECKVSRADYFADQKKPSRMVDRTERPAFECWYLTPPGLLRAEELKSWWGLLEAHDRTIRIVKPPVGEPWDDRTTAPLRHEINRLYCDIRRYHVQGLHYETYNGHKQRLRAERRASLPISNNPRETQEELE